MDNGPSEKRLKTVSTVLQSNLGQNWRKMLLIYLVFFILFMTILYFALVKTNFNVQLSDENSKKVYLLNLTLFSIVIFIIFISALTKLYKMYKDIETSDDSNNVKTIKISFLFGASVIIIGLSIFLVYFDYKKFTGKN